MALKLNKLFVRVPGDVTVADISAVSVQEENQKKLYFLENLHQIVNNGIAYGVDPDTVSDITDLQTLVGAKSISDSSADGKSVIERLQALEAIKVKAGDTYNDSSYITVTKDASNIPVIDLNIVGIDSEQNGLVDALNAKLYIDAQADEAKTAVVAGEGIELDTSIASADGHTIYTIDSSLSLQYHAAVTTEGSEAPATITLTGANGGNFGTINISDIIGNGVISGTDYDPATGTLTLTFNKADGSTQDVPIDLQEMLDLGDLMVDSDSSNYLTITTVSGEGDTNQASFELNVIDISTATANNTGLVDAWDLKEYIRTQTSDLTVRAEGDDYVSATIDANDNKKVVVETNVDDVSVVVGTVGTYDADGAQTAAPTHGSLSGTANTLVDGAQAATAIKDYIDGELAIESARIDASLVHNIKALDADVSTKGTNVSVGVTEVDGVITAVNVTETYAEISYDATNNVWTNTANVSTGLVTGQDIETLKSYVDDKVSDSSMDAEGDDYITASIDAGNNKKINVTADVQPLVVTTVAGTDTILTGVEKSLADSSNIATSVTSFVNTRIAEEVAKLDATATATDTYITMTVGEINGKVDNASTSVALTYGSMDGLVANHATAGIAKAEDVQDFVDGYDFWEEYTASNNNNGGN